MTVTELPTAGSQAPTGEQAPLDVHPHENEGVFISRQPVCEFHGTKIIDVRPYADSESLEEGTVWYDQFTMSDETIYRVKTGLPQKLMTDLPIDMSTPWWTAEEGHNSRAFLHFLSAGFQSRLYGPPRLAIPKGIRKFTEMPALFEKAFAIDMGKDVHNYAVIANYLDERNSYFTAPGLAMWYGESRAAMEGIGAQSRARLHGRHVLYLESVDPCMEHEPETGEIEAKDGLPELMAGARVIGRILFEPRRRHYRHTLDSSLSYIIPAIGTIRTLKSGQAGQFGDEEALDAQAHLTLFDQSIGNQAESWIAKFARYAGITHELLEGGHMTLAEREIVYRSLVRFAEVRNEYEKHGADLTSIDFEKVHATRSDHKANRIKTSTRLPKAA